MSSSGMAASLPSFLVWFTSVAAALSVAFLPGQAQVPYGVVAEGYITAVQLPTGFDVNGEHVVLGPRSGYALMGQQTAVSDSPLRNSIAPGAYVQVMGSYDSRHKIANAESVLFRDDWDKKLSGIGVIDKVISAGSEPVFRADGYRIRITSATEISFGGDIKTLSGVNTNTWLRYEGKRDKDGVLIASTARFLPPKSAATKGIKGLEVSNLQFEAPRSELRRHDTPGDATQAPYDIADQETVLTQDGRVKLGTLKKWHKVPADQALQSRVRHVGMRLVPEYQKQLPLGDPSRIRFRFYAIEEEDARSEICSQDGLILVPVQLLERFRNDDQLAAILADGVAYNLQNQGAKIVAQNRGFLGLEAAGYAADIFVPGMGIASVLGSNLAASKMHTAMEEQRGRVALALMLDAGYDPRQAPEAWRLAAPKHLPKDVDVLKYPDLSGYQLGILNLQYTQSGPASPGASARSGQR